MSPLASLGVTLGVTLGGAVGVGDGDGTRRYLVIVRRRSGGVPPAGIAEILCEEPGALVALDARHISDGRRAV